MAALLLIAVAAALLWYFFGRSEPARMLSGYIEGDSLYLAAPVAGTVAVVSVEEGARVKAGQPLFTLDPATLSAESEQARARIDEAGTQIAAASANAEQAEADVTAAMVQADKARSDLNRLLVVRRADPAAVAGKDVDAAEAALREASARLRAVRDVADARRAQVDAARARQAEAHGGERSVRIRVSQLSPAAPATGRIEEVFFRPGEWVAANQPIVGLLPDYQVKVRFFVPEAEAVRYRPGKTVRFSCDGCADDLDARITYVSPRPEFTPPVIFSRDSRDRLVFMVEARPKQPARLMPGLPVEVEPLR